MTNSELIKSLSLRLGTSQAEIKRLLTVTTETIKNLLDQDSSVTIPGLGTFRTLIRRKRKSFNPYHKKRMMLPPKRVVAFRAGSAIRKELKNERITSE